jgi:cytidylate kinase
VIRREIAARKRRAKTAVGAGEDATIARTRNPRTRPIVPSPSTPAGASAVVQTMILGTVRPPIASGWANDVDGRESRPNLGAMPVESNGHMEESDKKVVTAAQEGNSQAPRGARPAPATRSDQRDQPDHRHVIAIDGAAAAGKTTVARELAARLKVTLFDTGVLYRAVTLAALRRAVPLDDADRLAELAANLDIRVGRPTIDDGRLYDVIVDGVDVTWAIRSADVDRHVSQVSAHGPVRQALLPVQRTIADGASVVMVGRDIGTVVTPAAGVKIFLSAGLEERARRRHAELRARGDEVDLSFIVADLQRRDAIDSAREVSPLKASADAILIATDGRAVDEIVSEIEGLVRAAWDAAA